MSTLEMFLHRQLVILHVGRIDFVRLRIRVIGTLSSNHARKQALCGSPSHGRSSTARFGGVTIMGSEAMPSRYSQVIAYTNYQHCVFWLLAAADRMTETEQAKAQRFADFFGVGDGLASKTEDFIALPRELLLPATTRNRSGLIRHVYPVPRSNWTICR
ncbi:BQ5605_C006g03856 [Microbotryum silenes-dioicae]|uniref:BQ5605_C006g03856 protein n=1 Tax=Microbotryum silenes-dioicae TaxID=796604 RepID=A0A2X0M585_9BASI|nr:BQ5605_C006g03856 [Microbotryum silenes-dioicae]